MRVLARLTLAGVMLAAAVPARAGEVKVSFANGLVTIVATDASPRQILGEWARLGQVRITNLDRVSGGPLTLQLTDVPEAQALETVLRGTAGYVAAPRAEAAVAAARYDRILLLPGVAPAVPTITAPPPAAANSGAGRGRPSGIPTFDAAADDEPDPARAMPGMTPYRQPMPRPPGIPGQSTMPGVTFLQTPAGYPGVPTTQAPGATQQAPAIQRGPGYSIVDQRPWSSTGAAAPGMPTAPAPLPTTPYSSAGQPGIQTEGNTSASFPGQTVTQPGQIVNAPVLPARPGDPMSPSPTTFQNPYGLPEPVNPPVVNPNANPYGLPNPVKPPAPATTPGPIKKSGGIGEDK